jgi:hypothetical protein
MKVLEIVLEVLRHEPLPGGGTDLTAAWPTDHTSDRPINRIIMDTTVFD